MSKFLLASLVAFFFASCGANVKKTEYKNYTLAVGSGGDSFKPLLKRMIDDYNNNLGQKVLEYSDTMDTANSPVLFTKGLEARDGKVGWGQWIANSERRGSTVNTPGSVIDESTQYSLRVEFDQDYILKNYNNSNGRELNIEIRKLFAHEVGHGFQLEHVLNQKDVMYADVTGDKDFNLYWPRVRAFFAQ